MERESKTEYYFLHQGFFVFVGFHNGASHHMEYLGKRMVIFIDLREVLRGFDVNAIPNSGIILHGTVGNV
jgi:hypothetical protein